MRWEHSEQPHEREELRNSLDHLATVIEQKWPTLSDSMKQETVRALLRMMSRIFLYSRIRTGAR